MNFRYCSSRCPISRISQVRRLWIICLSYYRIVEMYKINIWIVAILDLWRNAIAHNHFYLPNFSNRYFLLVKFRGCFFVDDFRGRFSWWIFYWSFLSIIKFRRRFFGTFRRYLYILQRYHFIMTIVNFIISTIVKIRFDIFIEMNKSYYKPNQVSEKWK